jgi:hypothetical protein
LSPNPNNPTTFRRVAFLNDGEAVIMGNTQWDNFAFYQILDGTSKSSVDLYGFPAGYLYTGNVWGAPDGSRTLVAEFGISSQRAYDINATDLKMGARPTVDPYRVVFSRNAMVAIVNGTLVIDGAYASLGSLPASDAQIVSWDGARAYTYTMATRKIRAFDLTSPNGTGGFTEITLGAGATLDATTEDPGGYIGTMEISPDGGTLFICGINRIVIISISSL